MVPIAADLEQEKQHSAECSISEHLSKDGAID